MKKYKKIEDEFIYEYNKLHFNFLDYVHDYKKSNLKHKDFVEHLSPNDQIHFDSKIYEYIELNNKEFTRMVRMMKRRLYIDLVKRYEIIKT